MPHRLFVPINQTECDTVNDMDAPRDVSYPPMNDFRVQPHKAAYYVGGGAGNSMNSSHTGAMYETAESSVTSTGPPLSYFTVPPNHSDTNLFFRNLPLTLNDVELKAMFEPFGNVVSAAIMRDIYTGESLGTAFVRFETHAAALAAMQQYAHHPMGGHRGLVVQWAKKQHDCAVVGEARKKRMKLFVRNIPFDVTSHTLEELMRAYGSVESVTLHADTVSMAGQGHNNARHAAATLQQQTRTATLLEERRLIAFVTFNQEGAAAAACDGVHNTCPFPSCHGIPLMAKLADPNRQRTGHGLGHHQPHSRHQSTVSTPTSRASSTASSGHHARCGSAHAPPRSYAGPLSQGSPSLSATSNPTARMPHITQVPPAVLSGADGVAYTRPTAPASPPMYMSTTPVRFDPGFSTASSFNHSASGVPAASMSHGSYVDVNRVDYAAPEPTPPYTFPATTPSRSSSRGPTVAERRVMRNLAGGNGSLSGGEDTVPPYCTGDPEGMECQGPTSQAVVVSADSCYAAPDETWPRKPSADEVLLRREPSGGRSQSGCGVAPLGAPLCDDDGAPYVTAPVGFVRDGESAPLSLAQLHGSAGAKGAMREAGKSWGTCSTHSNNSSTMRYRHNPYNPVESREMVL